MDVMGQRIEYIYHQVHTLLAVCATWRKAILSCPALWMVVPFADHQKGRKRPLSAPLSLQQAGNKDLQLAMSLWKYSPQKFKALNGHWHRFSIINIYSHSKSAEDIHHVLTAIQKHSPPGAISKLSLRKEATFDDLLMRYNLEPYEPSISQIMCSLSVLRLSNFNPDWSRITFSDRLVELRLADMKLHDDSDITAFLTALSSAHELKELKLISVLIPLDKAGTSLSRFLSAASLPKLEHLHLEHLFLNVLQFVLSSTAPGAYCLTLNPLEETFFDYFSTGKERVDDDCICALLRTISIHKLILWGDRRFFWSTQAGLTRLLQSAPSVKILLMSYFPTNLNTLAALRRPLGVKSSHQNNFPTLTKLDIHAAFVETPLAQLKLVLNQVLESHRIQSMIFGGVFWINGCPLPNRLTRTMRSSNG